MPETAATVAAQRVSQTHEWLLQVAGELSDDQLAWRPAGAPAGLVPSAAWHLWHMARWADTVQAGIPGLTPELGERLGPGRQIWDAEGLAARWGLDARALGSNQTGMGLGDEDAERLKLPGKDALLEYARRAFAAADRAVSAVDDTEFSQRCTDLYGRDRTVGDVVLGHMSHASRHLGMIEALRGVMGLRGTATL